MAHSFRASPRPRCRRRVTRRTTSCAQSAANRSLPFRYHDKGSLATIGRKAAVAQLGRLKLSGVIAWLAWLLIHVIFLIGFRNRFLVVFQWAWSFLSYDRGAPADHRPHLGASPTERQRRTYTRGRRAIADAKSETVRMRGAYGNQTTWRLRIQSACLESRHGNVRRNDPALQGLGATGVADATRIVDIALEAGLNMFDSADIYSKGDAEEVLGQAIKGRRDQVIISTKGTFRIGPGTERRRLVALSSDGNRRGQPAAARDRLHRSVSTPRLRRPDARRRSARHARRPGPGRQDPLHRLLELLGLAPDEIAGRVGSSTAGALCRPPGLLFARRPRLTNGS